MDNNNNRDDLILDIVEKIHDNVEAVKVDIQDMKIEQVRQNLVVTTHELRSTRLEQIVEIIKAESDARLKSLEKDAQFFRNFVVIMTAVGSAVVALIKIFPNFHL